MIKSKCFGKSWIKKLKEKHPSGDPLLIERMIHAFELLGKLTKWEDNFVFKGGTALVLLLNEPRRVSIDIDITGDIPLDTLEEIVEDSVFLDFQEDERAPGNVPKSHYEFVYESAWDEENYSVLIDYIEDENVYPKTIDRGIDTEFFEVSEPLEVTVPGVEGLLADKLIAFAPSTVGIPYRQAGGDHTNSLRRDIIKSCG